MKTLFYIHNNVIPECPPNFSADPLGILADFSARANARSTSLRAFARALFGMSMRLISESVGKNLTFFSEMCRGSKVADSRLKRAGMTRTSLVRDFPVLV